MQLSGHHAGNDRVNSSVFSNFRNVASVDDDVMEGFKPLQMLEAATGKARSPMVFRLAVGGWSRAVEPDHSHFLDSMSGTGIKSLARYCGAVPCRQRNARSKDSQAELYMLGDPQPVKLS